MLFSKYDDGVQLDEEGVSAATLEPTCCELSLYEPVQPLATRSERPAVLVRITTLGRSGGRILILRRASEPLASGPAGAATPWKASQSSHCTTAKLQ